MSTNDWSGIAARHNSHEFLNPTPFVKMKNTVKTPREVRLTPIEKAEDTMKDYAKLAAKRKKADDKHKEAMKAIDFQLEQLELHLNTFATKEGAEFFTNHKSLKLACGTIGWKMTPGRLDYALEGSTPEQLRDLLVKRDPTLLRVDAAGVIKQVTADVMLATTLTQMGITVRQDDKFFVKPA
jgi:Bacteriophage Mu Gam like protein